MSKILVVEDDEWIRNMLRRLFTRQNPNVQLVFAGSVGEAINAIEAHDDFAVLLSDFNLGDGTGNDVAARFVEKFPEELVLGMTGNPNHTFDPNVFKHVLEKPFASDGDNHVLRSICS